MIHTLGLIGYYGTQVFGACMFIYSVTSREGRRNWRELFRWKIILATLWLGVVLGVALRLIVGPTGNGPHDTHDPLTAIPKATLGYVFWGMLLLLLVILLLRRVGIIKVHDKTD